MRENGSSQEKPDPRRLDALKRLPKRILETLSREELEAFLQDEVWPDSLREKLKDFLVD